MKDCCLRVWLLNLLNTVLSCPVWCLDNDALHEKMYLFMISVYLSVWPSGGLPRAFLLVFWNICSILFFFFFKVWTTFPKRPEFTQLCLSRGPLSSQPAKCHQAKSDITLCRREDSFLVIVHKLGKKQQGHELLYSQTLMLFEQLIAD